MRAQWSAILSCPDFLLSYPSGKMPLLSARPAVIFTAKERHLPLTSTKLYCLVTEAHKCEQLAQGCYSALSQWELNSKPVDRKSQLLTGTPLCHVVLCYLAE